MTQPTQINQDANQDSDSDSPADSDFRSSPSPVGSDYDSSSDEGGISKRKGRKGEDEKLASGDEGVVVEGSRKKRRNKKGKKGQKADADEDGDPMDIDGDEDGVGARLRRRKDKIAEKKVEKPSALAGQPVTIDVEEIWASINRPLDVSPSHANGHEQDDGMASSSKPLEQTVLGTQPIEDKMIAIQYHHTFAGETTTETKLIPKDSAEARLYLQSQPPSNPTEQPASKYLPENGKPMRRPLLHKSAFDTGEYANIGTSPAKWKLDRKKEQGQKMTTLEKSKLDWAKHVDERGIREELDAAGKSKGRYLDRMDFLNRSEAMREEELRRDRVKGL